MSNKPGQEQFLAQIERVVDWAAIAAQMQSAAPRVRGGLPLSALKLRLLARWYGLDEAGLVEACRDRLSFRRFLGLGAESDDGGVMAGWHAALAQLGTEVQNLVNSVETQLLSKGYTVKPGMWAEAAIVALSAEHARANEQVSSTTLFQPGEVARMLRQAEPVVARAGAHVHDRPPTTGSGRPQPLAPRAAKQVRGVIEWPWGATTELTEHLNVGRQFGFCPFARELQQYGHVSRKHAELLVYGDGIWVRDLGSSNGTFVNDEEVPKGQAYLVDTDSRIRFGPSCVIQLKLN